jgi:virginiamycin A acetyltransferase
MVKDALNLVALVIAAPAVAICRLERAISEQAHACFSFWTQVFALLPGKPGVFLRRAFYRCVLDRCAKEVTIEFGALFSRRTAKLERGVYVGPYAVIGSAWIHENCLIGTRASLLSGSRQHEMLPSGQWSATDDLTLETIVIGANTWIGEGAILMAGTGDGCMISAGAVVSMPVPAGTMVAGNPARFVRRVTSRTRATEEDDHERPISAIR